MRRVYPGVMTLRTVLLQLSPCDERSVPESPGDRRSEFNQRPRGRWLRWVGHCEGVELGWRAGPDACFLEPRLHAVSIPRRGLVRVSPESG